MDLSDLRKNYALRSFSKKDASDDPFVQFKQWFQEAVEAEMTEPNAMTLATASSAGMPSARVVLLKEVTPAGFVFFTNYESRKGQELDENPQAALLFCWLELERQIRIEGKVQKVSREASEKYFQSRPKKSQAGAWASAQSRLLESREILEQQMEQIEFRYAEAEALPVPPYWGGYLLVPTHFEFWQGRRSRLHDRIAYDLMENQWKKQRLAP
jgi:pyridoxamine 5'-phosphate oxidase